MDHPPMSLSVGGRSSLALEEAEEEAENGREGMFDGWIGSGDRDTRTVRMACAVLHHTKKYYARVDETSEHGRDDVASLVPPLDPA